MCLIIDCLIKQNLLSKRRLAIFYDAGYSSEVYEETTNVRGFGMANLWGDIGGYTGMFMGLSLLQVPDIVSGIFWYIQNKKMWPECRRHSETSTSGTVTEENQG